MKNKATKLLINATLLILVVSIIRLVTGASDLTSVGTASAALLLSVPIVLAGLGGGTVTRQIRGGLRASDA